MGRKLSNLSLIDFIFCLILFSASYFLCFHWGQKSYDLMHVSYMMDSAYRLLIGQWPTNDFATYITPLSFYLVTLGYLIFGISYETFLIVSGMLSGLITVSIYLFFLKKLSKTHLVIVSVLSIFYICGPYGNIWYTSTAVVMSYGCLFLFSRFLEKQNLSLLFWSGVFCALAFTAKQNIGGIVCVLLSLYLLITKSHFKNLFAFLFGNFLILGSFFVVLSIPEQARPFQEYILDITTGFNDRKGGMDLIYYIPYQASLAYLVPFLFLAWIFYQFKGFNWLTENKSLSMIGLCSLIQIGNCLTSTLDVSTNLSYTPLIFGFFIFHLQQNRISAYQNLIISCVLIYFAAFQYQACDDRRSLYGKNKIPNYKDEFVESIPYMRESDYTQGLDETFKFCQKIPETDSVWIGPYAGFIAALLEKPRPHKYVGHFKFTGKLTKEYFGDFTWKELSQNELPKWIVLQGNETFGLMSAKPDNLFRKNINKLYDLQFQSGLFQIFKIKK